MRWLVRCDTRLDAPMPGDTPFDPTPPAPADDAGRIVVKSPRPCPDCDGTGWLAGDPCPLCSGLAPGEREDARLKHQRAVEKARRADDASGAEAMRHAAAEIARLGAVVAYEQMADWRNSRSVAHTYADCMEAVGKALDECESMIRALPIPARADAVEETARALDRAVTRLSRAITFAPGDVDDARTEAYRAQDALRAALRREKGGAK